MHGELPFTFGITGDGLGCFISGFGLIHRFNVANVNNGHKIINPLIDIN